MSNCVIFYLPDDTMHMYTVKSIYLTMINISFLCCFSLEGYQTLAQTSVKGS